MTNVVVDTSVVLKWFHAEGEAEVTEARAVLAAHRDEALSAHILDLTPYELGNILGRTLRWPANAVADQLDAVLLICGPPLVPSADDRRAAAQLVEDHRLTFYDAAFAAVARAAGATLLSADGKLLASGLALSPAAFVAEHGLATDGQK